MSEAILEVMEMQNLREIHEKLLAMNCVDVKLLLGKMPQDRMLVLFRMLPKEMMAEVFAEMESEEQQYIVESVTDTEISAILEELYMDDTVDFLEEMPSNVVKRVLRNTDEAKRKLINQLLNYPEDSAGSVMTTEFIDLKKEMTVGQAIVRIRETGFDKETIDTCYVVSADRKLEGEVTIRKLILSPKEERVDALMEPNAACVQTLANAEEAARLFEKYDLISLPVVDNENRLVGIITVDDVMDVMDRVVTEDFHKMAAIAPSEESYLKTGVMELAKNRIVWLLVLMVSATLTGSIIRHYELTLGQAVFLAAYIPVLTDTGGNAGSQSSTIIIRSLALRELRFRNVFEVIWKEFRVGILTASALAIVNFARIMLFDHVSVPTALTVCSSMFCIVVAAKVIGAVLPMLAEKVHIDPAIMASPLITTLTDTFSLLIYFAFATSFLGIA